MKKQKVPTWFFNPPEPSSINDHSVIQTGTYLLGKSVAVLVTGSVAAMKTPLLIRALRRYGARVTVFASESALRYVGEDSLSWSSNKPVVKKLTPRSEHLHGSKPYDCYLVVPASYNTINKAANGTADSVVTTVLASALGHLAKKQCSVLFAPAMHGSMHNPILSRSMITLHNLGAIILKPRQEFGKNNLPSQDAIVSEVCRAVTKSKAKNAKILVTGGPTPVKIDDIRRLTNCFSGKLGINIAKELYLHGADVFLLQSASGIRPPKWLPHQLYEDYDDYLRSVVRGAENASYSIFSAAVADYGPEQQQQGKIPSGSDELVIKLKPLPKVIDEVKKTSSTKIISFKFEANATPSELRTIALKRILTTQPADAHLAVVANSSVKNTQNSSGHEAILFSQYPPGSNCTQQNLSGKAGIAEGIRKLIERCES